MSKIKVLIVDDIAETRENVKRLMYFEEDMEVVGEAGNGEEAVTLAEKLRPDIILMDINMPVMDGITSTEQISLKLPRAGIIIMSVQGEQEYLKKAMMAGAREYMVKPFSSDELAETIRKVFDFEARRIDKLVPAERKAEIRQEPQVITVFSTKGGVGKTTIATNLAVSLVRETGRKVALIDLDLQFGDVAVMLNVMPKRTLTELVQEIGQLDGELLGSYLVPHPSGVKILPAPTRPEYAELITATQVEKILGLLKQNYDYIIVDTPPVFNDTNLVALDASDQILLILALDLPTIKNIKLSLEVLESLHQRGKVRIILNRSSNDFGIKYEDVERSLGFLVAAHVPSDGRVVVASVNKGVPFAISHPGSPVTLSIKELTKMVITGDGTQEQLKIKEKKGLLKRLFG
ncbi:MAG: response regulator [Clostridia bacterium]|nr:response regulator [Clostridia bacterium]